MKVQALSYNNYYNNYQTRPLNKTFKGGMPVETIKHYNIGIMHDGYIGKIKLFDSNKQEAILNVFKKRYGKNAESYFIKDNNGDVIGDMDIIIGAKNNIGSREDVENSKHVFVSSIRNYSNPKTPYYKGFLKEYKQVGTRLLQIAQRRSDESWCNGNIELISKEDSMPFYEKLGFKKTKIANPYSNPNRMHLPPDAKEPLSRIYGGL